MLQIDDEALKHQVEEKKLRELDEKQRDLAYGKLIIVYLYGA